MRSCAAEHVGMLTTKDRTDLAPVQVRIDPEIKRAAQVALVGKGGLQRVLGGVVTDVLRIAVESGDVEDLEFVVTARKRRARKSA